MLLSSSALVIAVSLFLAALIACLIRRRRRVIGPASTPRQPSCTTTPAAAAAIPVTSSLHASDVALTTRRRNHERRLDDGASAVQAADGLIDASSAAATESTSKTTMTVGQRPTSGPPSASSAAVATADGGDQVSVQHGSCSTTQRPLANAAELRVAVSCRASAGGQDDVTMTGPHDSELVDSDVDVEDATFRSFPDSVLVPDSWPPTTTCSAATAPAVVVDIVAGPDPPSDRDSPTEMMSSVVTAAVELRGLRAELARERDRRANAEDWSNFLAETYRSLLMVARQDYSRRPQRRRIDATTGEVDAEKGGGGVPGLRRRYNGGGGSSSDEAAAEGARGTVSAPSTKTKVRSDDRATCAVVTAQSDIVGGGACLSDLPDYTRWLAARRGLAVTSTDGIRPIAAAAAAAASVRPETDDERAEFDRTFSYNEWILDRKRATRPADDCRKNRKTSASDGRYCGSGGAINASATTDSGRRGSGSATAPATNGFASQQLVRHHHHHPRDEQQQQQPQHARQRSPKKTQRNDDEKQTKRDEKRTRNDDRDQHQQQQLKEASATADDDKRTTGESAAACLMTDAGRAHHVDSDDKDDSEIWTLSVRERVNTWRRDKLTTETYHSSLQQQQQQQRAVTPELRTASNGRPPMTSSRNGDLPASSSSENANEGTDSGAATSVTSAESNNATTAPPTVDHEDSSSITAAASVSTTSGDEVVFEPTTKVGDARALFERIHH